MSTRTYNRGDAEHGGREQGCRRCGASLEGVPLRRRYCSACFETRRSSPTDLYECRHCHVTFRRMHKNRLLCDSCAESRTRRSQARKWADMTDAEKRAVYLRVRCGRFNITVDHYASMLAEQGGCCAICGTDNPAGRGEWHIDHDHSCCPGQRSCGKCVRGLLCNYCNIGLGHFNDDLDRLMNAMRYLDGARRGRLQMASPISA